MKKIINSENVQYQPVLTEELVLDDKATVGSFNGITSDAVARAVAGASGEVPEVTSSDNGKVLTAVYDEGGPAVEWAEAQGGVPASTADDSGKVLTVNSSGNPEWATTSGGSSSAFNTTFALSDDGTHVCWRAASIGSQDTIDLQDGDGVYAYLVEALISSSAAVDDVYNIEVRVGTIFNAREDNQAIGLQSDSDNYSTIRTSGILNIVSGTGISKSQIFVRVTPAKSSGASSSVFTGGNVKLMLAKL